MVSSMTAFASRSFTLPQEAAVLRWDIKSVNQRYFEASIKLPDAFQTLEYHFRDQLRGKMNRGKIFCQLQYEEDVTGRSQLEIDVSQLDALTETCAFVANRLKNVDPMFLIAPISPLDILKWPQIIKGANQDLAAIHQEIIKAFSETIQSFIQARLREGSDLKGFIEQRLKAIEVILKKIRERLPNIMSRYREKLMERMLDLKVAIDSNRLEQEMIFIAQKMDVAEELDRLDTHLQAVKTLLETGGVIGRHLDFLSQELNREANTLASKSVDALLTQETVELKVLIEQIREQVQNIE